MALILRAPPNFSNGLVLCRLSRFKLCAKKSVRFASLREPLKENPVPYSTNKASKLTIAQILGFTSYSGKKSKFNLWGFIISSTLAGLLIYFCVLPEEKEDETGLGHSLKEGLVTPKEANELLDLKLKLQYCTANNLPTDALKAKIEKLESKKVVTYSPFKL